MMVRGLESLAVKEDVGEELSGRKAVELADVGDRA